MNINYDLDLGCFRGMDNREIISWRLRSVRNYDTQQEVQDFSDFSLVYWIQDPTLNAMLYTMFQSLNNVS